MHTTAKAHGMDGTLVEPDWSPLTLEEVRTLLRRFPGLNEPIHILSTSPRPFSAASVIGTKAARIFIKRHHRLVRDREGLLEEHRFIEHLRTHGASVPRVLASVDGETAIEFGGWTYEVHEVPAGVDPYGDAPSWTPFRSLAHARSAGQALARLHLAAQGFTAPARLPRPLVASFSIFAAHNPHAAMKNYLAARPALASNMAVPDACRIALALLTPLHAELRPLLPSLASLWTHNDLHGSNLLWSDMSENAHAVAVIDFGLADRTNAVHDLAHAIERNIVEWLALTADPASFARVPVHLDSLHALLDGYESIRPLTQKEAAALAPMAALCHAEFALTESDYFLGVLRSHSQARMAVPDYLVNHARWFRSASGEKLLELLRRRATDLHSREKSVAP